MKHLNYCRHGHRATQPRRNRTVSSNSASNLCARRWPPDVPMHFRGLWNTPCNLLLRVKLVSESVTSSGRSTFPKLHWTIFKLWNRTCSPGAIAQRPNRRSINRKSTIDTEENIDEWRRREGTHRFMRIRELISGFIGSITLIKVVFIGVCFYILTTSQRSLDDWNIRQWVSWKH